MNGLLEKQTCAPLNHIFLNLFLILSVCHLVAGWTPLFNGTYFKIALLKKKKKKDHLFL